MLFILLSRSWIQYGALLTSLIPGIAARASFPQYSNSSSSISVSTTTTRSTSHATITSCATLGPLDFYPASLRSLPPSVLASIQTSEYARLQEIVRVWTPVIVDLLAPTTSTNFQELSRLYSLLSSTFTSVQKDVVSKLGPSGYAYLNLPGITDPCLLSTCVDQFLSQGSSFSAANPSAPWIYQAQSPCCGQCQVTADAVEVLYWPTPATTPAVSTLVDAPTNYTFVSPSVYAIFTDLQARNLCGQVDGGFYPLATVSFGATDLSTSSFPVNPSFSALAIAGGEWTAIDYRDFGPQCTCTADCPFDPIRNETIVNLCTPQLSIPSLLTELVPAWATCSQAFGGTFDPPIALGLVDGLTTPKDTPAQSTPDISSPTTSLGPTAAPVGSPNSPIVTPTLTPQPQSITTSPIVVPIPPAKSDNPSPPPVEFQPASPATVSSQPVDSPALSPFSSPTQAQPSSATPVLVVPTPITIANSILTPLPGTSSLFVVGTQTLSPGGPPVTINGATISIPASASAITLSAVPTVLTIAGETLTADANSNFVFGTQTLIPGGPAVTVNGETISLPSPASSPPPTVLTIAGETLIADSSSNFLIGSQTLVPGGAAITVSETPISLAEGATQVVVGGTTETLGSIIMSVFNGGTSTAENGGETGTATVEAPAEFTGGAVRQVKNMGGVFVYMGVVLSVLMIFL